jgi:4-hydroxy-tetrahydrodipicolinate reductase
MTGNYHPPEMPSFHSGLLIILFSPVSVSLEIQHNVCGRSIYAEGSVDAAVFLYKKVCVYLASYD